MSGGTVMNDPATTGLEYKATQAGQESGLIDADDNTGVVEAIVSVTGVYDNDHDLIEPGAYKTTLTRRRPKGIFSHDWGRWASRTEAIEELMPGDPRLTDFAAKMGKPWPAEAGGLYVKTRYNLATQTGRDAYHDVKFFAATGECEWSIGYKVPPGKAFRAKDGRRRIKEIDLYEYSPVLFGANSMSGTLSVKTAQPGGDAEPGIDWDEIDRMADAAAEPPNVEPGLGEDPEPDDPQQGPPDVVPDLDDEPDEAKAHWDPKEHPRDKDGQFIRSGDSVTISRTGETGKVVGQQQDGRIVVKPDGKRPRAIKPGMLEVQTGAGDSGPAGGKPTAGNSASAVEEHDSPPGPVSTVDRRSVRPGDRVFDATSSKWREVASIADRPAFPGDPGFDEDPDINAHITVIKLRKPKEITGPHATEVGGHSDGQIEVVRKGASKSADGIDTKMAHESLNRSPKKNWVEMAGQLPAYIQHIANDLHQEQGMPLERAIPTAIAAVKRWAAGGGNVKPETRAKAAKAVAEWEALKAKSRARAAANKGSYDPELEVGPDAGHIDPPIDDPASDSEDVAVATAPHLPGTYEELRDLVHAAATKILAVDEPFIVEVLGTWPDRAVVTRYLLDDERKTESFEIPFTADVREESSAAPPSVDLGDPIPVTLTIDDGEGGDGVLLPYPAMVEDVSVALKTMLAGHEMENKAGRVLSGANANRLKGAVEQLVAVLKAAGIEIGAPDKRDDVEERAPVEEDSTAPSARADSIPEGKVLIDPTLHARAYRIIGDALARS